VLAIAFLLAASSAIIASANEAAAQDTTATAAATPTQEELQQRRDEAIAGGADQLELTFEEYNDSGIEGTATFYALDDQTLVAIAIEGGGESHPAFILEGTCGNTEPLPFERLGVVDETGEHLSLIDRPLTDLIDGGDYTIDLRLSPNELGTLIACANIEGQTTPATPAPGATQAPTTATAAATETPTVAPTGEGGVTETPAATATTAPPETPTATETPTVAPTGEGGVTETPTATATATTPATATATAAGGKGTTLDGTGGAHAAPGAVASLPLTDYSGLGVTGTVTLNAVDDDSTMVTITLEGDAVTGGHIAHLHPGTCEALEDEGTIYLAEVGANGVSETTVGLSLDALLTDGWSVNVHLSEAEWDTWLVCGYLGSATGGMTGVADVTPIAGGKGTTVQTGSTGTGGDGTSGVSGKGDPVDPSTLTQGVGVGSTLAWPSSPAQAIAWSLAAFAAVLAVTGIAIRRGERAHRQPTRWQRLGL
jgi:hypothetical protein